MSKESSKFEGLYVCPWPGCGEKFTAIFGKVGKSGGGTSPVRCPNCNNYVKPLQDAITVKELKEVKRRREK